MDFACWLLWSEDHTFLEGIIHVDDLLLGGTQKMIELGKELGHGSISYRKKIDQLADGTVQITNMKGYHRI